MTVDGGKPFCFRGMGSIKGSGSQLARADTSVLVHVQVMNGIRERICHLYGRVETIVISW